MGGSSILQVNNGDWWLVIGGSAWVAKQKKIGTIVCWLKDLISSSLNKYAKCCRSTQEKAKCLPTALARKSQFVWLKWFEEYWEKCPK